MEAINQVVVPETGNEVLAVDEVRVNLLDELAGEAASDMVHNFDLSTRLGKIKLFEAMESATKRIGDNIGETIEATNFLIKARDYTDPETGEKRIIGVSVLLDSNGETWFSSANGIFKSLYQVAKLGLAPTEEEPTTFKIIQRDIGNGHRTYKLKVVS